MTSHTPSNSVALTISSVSPADVGVATVPLTLHAQLKDCANGTVSMFYMQIDPAGDHGLVQWGSGGRQVQVRDIPAFNVLEVLQPVNFNGFKTNNLKQWI